VYRASDDTWFVLIVTPDKLAAVANAIGRADLLTDPRFTDPGKLMQNMPQLAEILDQVFSAQPMTHWYQVFNGVHVTFGAVRGPLEVIEDPQLRLNDIVVPLDGAGGKLGTTIWESTMRRYSNNSGSARAKSPHCMRAALSRRQRSRHGRPDRRFFTRR
jgi:crotonobetainyl-CoA:carnitine CoA-transferase CaiB-like acyl-CoA transferase